MLSPQNQLLLCHNRLRFRLTFLKWRQHAQEYNFYCLLRADNYRYAQLQQQGMRAIMQYAQTSAAFQLALTLFYYRYLLRNYFDRLLVIRRQRKAAQLTLKNQRLKRVFKYFVQAVSAQKSTKIDKIGEESKIALNSQKKAVSLPQGEDLSFEGCVATNNKGVLQFSDLAEQSDQFEPLYARRANRQLFTQEYEILCQSNERSGRLVQQGYGTNRHAQTSRQSPPSYSSSFNQIKPNQSFGSRLNRKYTPIFNVPQLPQEISISQIAPRKPIQQQCQITQADQKDRNYLISPKTQPKYLQNQQYHTIKVHPKQSDERKRVQDELPKANSSINEQQKEENRNKAKKELIQQSLALICAYRVLESNILLSDTLTQNVEVSHSLIKIRRSLRDMAESSKSEFTA